MPADLALLAVVSFFLGSIPFGLFVARAKGVDIRAVGSGNIGATNVWRNCGPAAGTIAFLADVAKGLGPALYVLLSRQDQQEAFFIGLAAVLGHTFSPWLGFRGGKGIATGFGALIGSLPVLAGISFAGFLLVLAATGYVSLASIFAGTVLMVIGLASPLTTAVKVALVLFWLFIVVKHRDNIGRLRSGTESKFSFRKKQAPPV